MTSTPAGLDPAQFLARHWQREPLLIRGAIPGFAPPVSADELAGLALEEEVESRLVAEDGGNWRLRHGPFGEADFAAPPPWTLLVQAVDQYLSEVAALRRLVNFIPDWRGDDIMVSYATDGGSVGPHYDHYDVFLLQGEGQRLWRLGQRCDEHSPLLPGNELRILAEFDCRQEYLLGPGDMLYVPPGLAHWGIARGECTTFSIGYRAPRRQDLLARLADQALEEDPAAGLFSDPGRAPAGRPGEIGAADLERAREQALALLRPEASPRWFGELVTEPRYPAGPEPADPAGVAAVLAGRASLYREPGARIAWCEAAGGLQVFANGASHLADTRLQALVEQLCDTGELVPDHTAGAAELESLLYFLLETGSCHVG